MNKEKEMTTAVAEQEKEITSIQNEVPTIVADALAFKVTNDAQYHEAVELANVCKTKLQRVLDFFRPMKESAHKAWKEVVAKENQFAPALEDAKKLYTQKAADYQFAKQKEQAEKEEKARLAAEKIEFEKKAKLEEEARAAEAAGNLNKADLLREKAADTYVAPRPVAQAPKATGLSVQTVWEPQVIDESLVPVMYWKEIDLAKLKRMKKDNPKLEVPGIKFVQKAQGGAIGRAA
jgi:hypothetical protein